MWRKVMVLGALGGLVVSGSAAGRVHAVKRGDTLSGIAQRYGVDTAALAAANGLAHPDRIVAGSVLSIPGPGGAAATPAGGAPGGRSHRVGLGETLEAIARRYGVTVTALAAANGLPNPDFVRSGTVLRIPAATGAAPAVARPAPNRATGQGIVVPMPAATLAAARTSPRIAVPPDRAGLRTAFVQFSRLAGAPSDLAMALAWQESGWQRNKVSSTQAVGVMQLMPDTVDFVSTILLGTRRLDPRDPIANIRMGTRFLRYLLDSNGGNVDLALASYYQGLRSVRENGMLDETRRFVANVKALRGRF
ncbi:MAG: LysM peptidoglycan-binding domain-containing protein [Actinomycetota bacterium]|jgi:N-acetylmuramoyl-L-alanine amidase